MRPPDPNDKGGLRKREILQWYAAHDHPVPNTVRSWAGPRMPIPLAAPRGLREVLLRHPDWYAQPRRRKYS